MIRSRSTRCLSFPLTVTAFLASSSWTLYGLWLEDLYITVGWGQREAGGCCGFPPPPSSPAPFSGALGTGPDPVRRRVCHTAEPVTRLSEMSIDFN